VRAYVYGYDSDWLLDAPAVSLKSLAKTFLDSIKVGVPAPRAGTPRRKVFIAHSHGGLVVKKALIDDHMRTNKGSYCVSAQTDGIIFLGTPHKGSGIARLGKIASWVLSAWGSHTALLADLCPGSWSLQALQEDFEGILSWRNADSQLGPIHVWNVCEERKTTIIDFGFGLKFDRLVSEAIWCSSIYWL
jgi:hypothetical protein